MSDASTEPAKGRANDPEARLTSDFAHTLWLSSMGTDLPKDAEARKAAWKEAKKSWMQMARASQKRLSRQGIVLTRSEVSDPEAVAEAAAADA